MPKFRTLFASRSAAAGAGLMLAIFLSGPATVAAQDKTDTSKGTDPHAPPVDKSIASQIAELHAKVARLEAALKQDPKATASGMPGMSGMGAPSDKTGADAPGRVSAKFQNCLQCHQSRPSGPLPPSHLEKAGAADAAAKDGGMAGMPGMGDKKKPAVGMGMMGMMEGKGMGMMGMDKMKDMGMPADKKSAGGMGMSDMDEMKGMAAMGGGKPGMGMMDMDMMEMMGMAPKSAGGMAGMKNMGKMQAQAALPGFPGESHIYHIGATDFFLNHPEHIDLTSRQQGDLSRLKEKALLAKATAQRRIDEAEQELWTLTSSDEPDAAKIETRIQEIEKMRGSQRMALIRAVGDAAKLLTDEQRQVLLGTGADKAAKPDPHAGHKQP